MPNRILKESICTSSTVDALGVDEERFFYRLIVQADDFGRMDARPQIVRARCFPLKLNEVTDGLISDYLRRCAEVGLIELYSAGGQPYLQFVTWDKHQQVRAKRSRYPDPDSNGYQVQADDRKCPRNPIRIQSESESESEHVPAALVSVAHPAPKPDGYSVAFERFWSVYPRKIEKKATWRVWQARIREGVEPESLTHAAVHYAEAKRLTDPQHVKHARTFLGSDRAFEEWIDGIPLSERGVNGQRTGSMSKLAQNAAIFRSIREPDSTEGTDDDWPAS